MAVVFGWPSFFLPKCKTFSFYTRGFKIINIGSSGAQIPVFREEASRFTPLGKEVRFTEKCPTLGAKGDLILADLSQYAIGMRKEIALDRSNVPGWLDGGYDRLQGDCSCNWWFTLRLCVEFLHYAMFWVGYL